MMSTLITTPFTRFDSLPRVAPTLPLATFDAEAPR